jgi:lysophospholipase L1-like esterase
LLTSLLAGTTSAVGLDQYPVPFELKTGDRVVLLGGTFIERAQRYGWLETALQLRFPDANFTVRNLGWSGDTVFAESRGIFDAPAKGYERMIAQVRGLKPSVIFLNYGANESFRGPEYLDTFLRQYEKLLDDLKPTEARFVVLGPPPLWHMPAPLPNPERFNKQRQLYSSAIEKLAEDRPFRFVNLFDMLTSQSKKDDSRQQMGTSLSDDGVTLNELGYTLAAEGLAESLSPGGICHRMIHVAASGDASASQSCSVDQPVPTVSSRLLTNGFRLNLDFAKAGYGDGEVIVDLRDNWADLPREIQVDGVVQRTLRPKQHAIMVSVVEPLRQAIIDKNIMYFHHWRPQNVTYLFLFRKHEQGNNAKEIGELKVIVANLDQRIAASKETRQVTIDIIQAGDNANE